MRKTHGACAGVNRNKNDEYRIWIGIKSRCYNPKATGYEIYGARGIVMSDDWRNNFSSFLRDMGPRPSKGHSTDRIDVNGNYCKENCRWSTTKEQAVHKRNTVYLTAFGKTKRLVEWAAEIGERDLTIQKRLMRGWSVERAVSRRLA